MTKKEIVKSKTFFTKEDIAILLDCDDLGYGKNFVSKVFREIKKLYAEDLEKRGAIPPSRNIVVAEFAWQYLTNYGIRKEN